MFPIQMTFTVSTMADLDRLVAATSGAAHTPATPSGNTASPPGETATGKPEKAKPAPVEKAKGADTQPTAAAAAAQPSKDSTSDKLDYERDVRPRFLALATAPGKGRDAQLRVLALAGCEKKLTEIAGTQEGLQKALAAVAQVEAE